MIRYCSLGPSERGWSRGCWGGPSRKAPGSCWVTGSKDHLCNMMACHLLHAVYSFLTHVSTKTIPTVYDEMAMAPHSSTLAWNLNILASLFLHHQSPGVKKPTLVKPYIFFTPVPIAGEHHTTGLNHFTLNSGSKTYK